MNDYHSQKEWKYIPRWITGNFSTSLRAHPVLVVTGPRQAGKTTFLRNAEATRHWPYMSMDDLDLLSQAQRDPSALLAGKSHLIIDEIQKAPQLMPRFYRWGLSKRFCNGGMATSQQCLSATCAQFPESNLFQIDCLAVELRRDGVPNLDHLVYGQTICGAGPTAAQLSENNRQ